MKPINFGLKVIASSGILFLLLTGALIVFFKHSAGTDYMINFNPITGNICAPDTNLKISSVEISTNSVDKIVLRVKDSLTCKNCINLYHNKDSSYYYAFNQFSNDTQNTFQLKVIAKGPGNYRSVEFRQCLLRSGREVVNIKSSPNPW